MPPTVALVLAGDRRRDTRLSGRDTGQMVGSSYLVSFRGAMTEGVRLALERVGMTLVGATGGGVVAPGGDLPGLDRHYVRVSAASEEAVTSVTGIISGHGGFSDFVAEAE